MAVLKVTFTTHCFARQAFETSLSADEVAAFNASTANWPTGIQGLSSARIYEDPSQLSVFEVVHRFDAALLVDSALHPKPFEMVVPEKLLGDVFNCLMWEGGLPNCELDDSSYEVIEHEPV